MVKRIRRHAPRNGGPRVSSGASYTVGYARPPQDHRFQPGQSGNRKGRPKGAKNTSTLLREILDRPIEVRSGGTIRKMTVREAMLTRFAESALKGDTKSAAFLLQRYDMLETDQEHTMGIPIPEEQEIIAAYFEKYPNNGGKKK